MLRRDFLTSSMLALGSALVPGSLAAGLPPAPADPRVKRVLVMFKCHFDAGFIDTQAAVVHRYFSEYFPKAIDIAQQSRLSNGRKYVWTTGSWLLYEYLEQASPEDRRRMEQAVERGDIAWHALPFTWQTEMLDPSMIEAATSLSRALDRRFGHTTKGAKMTDVPGHTRGLISPLASAGVTFLDIGVNDASTPAEVPPLFLWKDSKGASLITMYHHGYGGIAQVPGSDLAIAVVVRGDNSGPHTLAEIAQIYSDLQHQFPNAQIEATGLATIATAVEPFRSHLPTATQEIGDTWIHGIASDPVKVARYREVARLRLAWIERGEFRSGDATDLALLRHVLLEVEHTWGTDTKTWLDFNHYTPADLAPMLETHNYKVVAGSWAEKRQDLFDGIATLPKPLQKEAQDALSALAPEIPEGVTGTSHPPQQTIETSHFTLAIDPGTGAIHRLINHKTGREWADPDHPIALITYQTLSAADYSRFMEDYLTLRADWALKDFGKPNIEKYGAESREWHPVLLDLRVAEDANGWRIIEHLGFEDKEASGSGRAAFPETMYFEFTLPRAEPVVRMDLSCFKKQATRMPEALWLTFDPKVSRQDAWMMEKSGEKVSPFDVIVGGSRRMHAVSTGFRNQQGEECFAVETIDAPLIALGQRSPLCFSRSQPDLSSGVHSNLFNNAWGTNYIMWFGEDMRFRFNLRA